MSISGSLFSWSDNSFISFTLFILYDILHYLISADYWKLNTLSYPSYLNIELINKWNPRSTFNQNITFNYYSLSYFYLYIVFYFIELG